ncbi:MAG TPA: hypothetical protein VE983_09445, partial [Solirubrobacteraceae bacterium]|nr:hypothetical protein [Solirubrobacteraceae bacterium]
SLCCGSLPIDVIGAGTPSAHAGPGSSNYQELLYEATRIELTSEVCVEVASPEDIEHYVHLRRTGSAPQITISRREPSQNDGDEGSGSGHAETGGNGHAATGGPPAGEQLPTSQTRPGGNGPAPTAAPHPDSPTGSV